MRFSSLINSKCSQSEDGSLPPSRVTITGPALEKSFSIPTREGDFSSADGRPLLTITLCKEAYNLIEEKVEKRPVCYTFYTNTTIDEGRKKRFLDWEIFSSDRAILILNNVRARSVRRGWHTTSNREKKKTEWGTNKKRNPTIRGITCSLALFPLVMSMCLKYFFFLLKWWSERAA